MNLDLMAAAVVGLLAGGLAGSIMESGPFGRRGDLILGLVGGIVAVAIFRALGILPRAGMFAGALVALVGAATLLFGQRQVWHKPGRSRRRRSVASGAWRAKQA